MHAIAAGCALLFGAFQLLRRSKGGPVHRIVGRAWVGAMYVVVGAARFGKPVPVPR